MHTCPYLENWCGYAILPPQKVYSRTGKYSQKSSKNDEKYDTASALGRIK